MLREAAAGKATRPLDFGGRAIEDALLRRYTPQDVARAGVGGANGKNGHAPDAPVAPAPATPSVGRKKLEP